MDVFALPSLREGFSISLLEAMASGRVVIATGVGGNTEVISDGENGFIIPENTHRLLAEKIIEVLKNKNLKSRIEGNAKERVRDFSIDRMLEKTTALYDELLSVKNAGN